MKSTPSFFEYQLISQEWCICLVGTGCHQLHFAEDETRIHSSNGWGIFSNRTFLPAILSLCFMGSCC